MFCSKNKKKIPQFCYMKVGFKGVYIARTCFPDELQFRRIIFQTKHFFVIKKSIFEVDN